MKVNRSGFSLVLSLTIMAGMVLMVIVLASFLQVESRLAQSHSGYMRARFNALASARIAVGQLQQLAGPDQRVTMRADMFDAGAAPGASSSTATPAAVNPASISSKGTISHQKRYWTGVWATGGVDSSKVRDWNVKDPHETRLFLGWLTSPSDIDATETDIADKTKLPNYLPNHLNYDANGKVSTTITTGQDLIKELGTAAAADGDLVPLVSRGTVSWPASASTRALQQYYGAIDARPMPLPGGLSVTGRYAFWIGDEGIKAKANLPDAYAMTTTGTDLKGLEVWDKGFRGTAAQRNAIELIGGASDVNKTDIKNNTLPGGFNFEKWRNDDITAATDWDSYKLPKVTKNAELETWAANIGGTAAGEAMADAMKILWHDVTTLSFSTLTDTYNGGIKTDLSTAFELPYTLYRGIEMYPLQKTTRGIGSVLKQPSFFHGAQGPTDLDFNRPNLQDKIASNASNLIKASPRASEWAPRWTQSVLGAPFSDLKTRNNGETPERMGFVYEAPLRSGFFNAERIAVNTTAILQPSSVTYYDLAPYSLNNTTTDINNLQGRIVRGPTWDLYRNYYRMYKREVEAVANGSTTLRGQSAPTDDDTFVARGVEPLSYASGVRSVPLQKSGNVDSAGQLAAPKPLNATGLSPTSDKRPENYYYPSGVPTNYFYRNNLSDGTAGPDFQADKRMLYGFGMPIAIDATSKTYKFTDHVNFMRSGIASPTATSAATLVDSNYGGSGGMTQATTTRPWPTSPALMPSILRFSLIFSAVRNNEAMGMYVDPVIVVHNPYDCAIEFEGIAMESNGASVPYIFTFSALSQQYYSSEGFYADNLVSPFKNFFLQPTAIKSSVGPAFTELLPVLFKSGYVYDITKQPFPYYDATHPELSTNTLQPKFGGPIIPFPANWPTDSTLPYKAMIGPIKGRTSVAIGDVVIGEGDQDNRQFSFRIVAGTNGTTNPTKKVIRLKPGEIRIITTSSNPGAQAFGSDRKNTVIGGDIEKMSLESRAFYKMTHYANVYKQHPSTKQYLRLADLTQIQCYNFSFQRNKGGPPTVDYAAFSELWDQARNARVIRDAFNGWNGEMVGTRTYVTHGNAGMPPVVPAALPTTVTTYGLDHFVLTGETIKVTMRNEGYLGYHNCVLDRLQDDDDLSPLSVDPSNPNASPVWGTIAPASWEKKVGRTRTGKISIAGNQVWNFYLINNKDADGKDLNPNRRWFGAPETVVAGTTNLADVADEGNETAPGWHLVDEPLLLNLQAMTSGWPMYGNGNHDWNLIMVAPAPWQKYAGGTPPTANYQVLFPETTGSFQQPEVTGWKGNTLKQINALQLDHVADAPGSTKIGKATRTSYFMMDLLVRAADMTEQTSPRSTTWYPKDTSTNGFEANGFTVGALGDRFKTQAEMLNAPMSPFFLSTRAQQAHLFGYDGKAHSPIGWVLSQRGLDALGSNKTLDTDSSGKLAFWGKSVTSAGQSNVILHPLPRRPMLSLAQLGSVPFAQVNTDPDLTVGSSFANPGIADLTEITDWPGPKTLSTEESALQGTYPGDKVTIPEQGYVAKVMGVRTVRNRSNVRTDHAFAANLALWDTFYFSGLNLATSSYSPGNTVAADLATEPAVKTLQDKGLQTLGVTGSIDFSSLKTALNNGKKILANKRVTYAADGKDAPTLSVADNMAPNQFPHPAYLGRNALYDGGFNVNSTSKAAWKAVLGGLRGMTISGASSSSGTALTRFANAFDPSGPNGKTSPWNSYRELSDVEIDTLAEKVVIEVRRRGPFMSLGDFVNRRLLGQTNSTFSPNANPPYSWTDKFSLKGALQAAIDAANINKDAIVAAGGTFSRPASVLAVIDPNGPETLNYGDKTYTFQSSAYESKGAVIIPNNRFPSLRAMSETNDHTKAIAGLGAPGIVTQMDVLNSVGPNLTPRSDTFVVRAFGEALDNAGASIGKAWVEIVVQRTAEYFDQTPPKVATDFDPTKDEVNRRKLSYRTISQANTTAYDKVPILDQYEPITASTSNGVVTPKVDAANLNRLFGRRFKTTSLRWLNASEL